MYVVSWRACVCICRTIDERTRVTYPLESPQHIPFRTFVSYIGKFFFWIGEFVRFADFHDEAFDIRIYICLSNHPILIQSILVTGLFFFILLRSEIIIKQKINRIIIRLMKKCIENVEHLIFYSLSKHRNRLCSMFLFAPIYSFYHKDSYRLTFVHNNSPSYATNYQNASNQWLHLIDKQRKKNTMICKIIICNALRANGTDQRQCQPDFGEFINENVFILTL